MKDISKYQGIIPAFYACYDKAGEVSPEGVRALTKYFVEKGVKGVYVGGSSGECIYQSVAERKLVLENVMAAAEGKLTVIAHVACNNTRDSKELAAHAESLGVDAVAAIPPIYFHLPEINCSSGPLKTTKPSPPSALNIWISCTGMEEFLTAATRGFFSISRKRGMVRATPASWGML